MTQVPEIWQQSPTLIIFSRHVCRFCEVAVVEAVEAEEVQKELTATLHLVTNILGQNTSLQVHCISVQALT